MNTQREPVDIDRLVDYQAAYRQAVGRAQITGDKLRGRCPFHDDQNSSFSADLRTGQWMCFAEGIKGNYLDFYARLHHTDTKTAYREILNQYGVCRTDHHIDPPQGSRAALAPYTLRQYAFEKHLPEDWLRERCGLSDGSDYNRNTHESTAYLKIPYWDESGQLATYRKRFGCKAFRWKQGSHTVLYGLWRLPEFREKQAVSFNTTALGLERRAVLGPAVLTVPTIPTKTGSGDSGGDRGRGHKASVYAGFRHCVPIVPLSPPKSSKTIKSTKFNGFHCTLYFF